MWYDTFSLFLVSWTNSLNLIRREVGFLILCWVGKWSFSVVIQSKDIQDIKDFSTDTMFTHETWVQIRKYVQMKLHFCTCPLNNDGYTISGLWQVPFQIQYVSGKILHFLKHTWHDRCSSISISILLIFC